MSVSNRFDKLAIIIAFVAAACACCAFGVIPHAQVWAVPLSTGAPAVTAQAASIDEARTLIEALPASADVVEGDAARIQVAREAYDSLSQEDQRLLDTETNRAALHTTQSYGRVLELAEAGLAVLHEVDNSTSLVDGVYTTSVSSSWNRGKSASKQDRDWTAVRVRVQDGKAFVTLRVNSSTYSFVRAGGVVADRLATSNDDESDFTFPVSLGNTMTFIGYSDTMATEIAYYLNASVASGALPDMTLEEADDQGSGESGVDPASNPDAVGAPQVVTDPVTGNSVVEQGSFVHPDVAGYMSRMVAPIVIMSDGQNMTVHAQMKSTSYSHLFLGTPGEIPAEKSLEEGVADGTFIQLETIVNAAGEPVGFFTFPLASLDKDIPMSMYSVKNEHWVDLSTNGNSIRFNSADLEWRQTDEEAQQLQAVISLLESLPARNTIVPDNPEHEAVVAAARAAYDSLDRLRKSLVPSRLLLLLNWDESMFELGFNTEQLPLALVGQAYDGALYVSGKNGEAGKTIRVVEGSLPKGLSLQMDNKGLWAHFAGTPQENGSSTFTVELANGVETVRKQFTIHVGYAPKIVTEKVADAQVGVAYEQIFQVDAYPDATWSLLDGKLPAGLTFADDGEKANTARLTGTPTAEGTFTFTLACDNFANGIESRSYTLRVTKAMDAAAEHARAEKLAQELTTAKKEVDTLEKQKAALEKQQATLEKQKTSLQNENDKLAKDLKKANAKVKKLEAQLPRQVVVNTKTVTAKRVKTALKKANNPYATKITLGAKVTVVKKNAFAGTDARTLIVKTKKLTTKRVKNALKGSSIKSVKVQVNASAKSMKKIKKAYKSAFAKKNIGRKVTLTFAS